MLTEQARQLRRLMRESVEEDAPAFRVNKAEVDRLIDALLSGSQVKPRVSAILGKDGDVEAFLADLRYDLQTILFNKAMRMGGKVSGASAAAVKTALRGMAQGEDAPASDLDPAADPAPPLSE